MMHCNALGRVCGEQLEHKQSVLGTKSRSLHRISLPRSLSVSLYTCFAFSSCFFEWSKGAERFLYDVSPFVPYISRSPHVNNSHTQCTNTSGGSGRLRRSRRRRTQRKIPTQISPSKRRLSMKLHYFRIKSLMLFIRAASGKSGLRLADARSREKGRL